MSNRTIHIPSKEYDEYLEELKKQGESPELSNDKSTLMHCCPICKALCVSDHSSTTLVGYMSPEGHDHDDNCRTFNFSCCNGHKFTVRVRNTCPTCDWKGVDICSTCGPNIQVEGQTQDVPTPTTFIYHPSPESGFEGVTYRMRTDTMEAGYFYAPYIPVTKAIINTDKSGMLERFKVPFEDKSRLEIKEN